MLKAFSVASWNVEHFHGEPERTDRVVSFVKEQDADIIALYEVKGKDIFLQLIKGLPGYIFQITEGPETQEILVGIRNNITAFITQKLSFKSGVTYMRPGVLLTIAIDEINYSLLFLHLASGTNPRGMGLRDDMFHRAVKFKDTLDRAYGNLYPSNYIFLGDLNTMGMRYPFEKNIDAETELHCWDEWANKKGMRRLRKTYEKTWSGGSTSSYKPSNLDHVFASIDLIFKQFGDTNEGKIEVDVRGWVDKSITTDRDEWIANYSDHSLIYFEVDKNEK